ncbi:hypothetical protein [Burkholderia glumae]|uniref:hypothetical protein n=1 Tax=Burkholderia glumae TaxID=337 RepID=UPI0014641F9F|nr:hypothetical protein [Burkholderia glumae]QJP70428.1 hypothetical protein HJC54_09195 [Burkholderia glumae]
MVIGILFREWRFYPKKLPVFRGIYRRMQSLFRPAAGIFFPCLEARHERCEHPSHRVATAITSRGAGRHGHPVPFLSERNAGIAPAVAFFGSSFLAMSFQR